MGSEWHEAQPMPLIQRQQAFPAFSPVTCLHPWICLVALRVYVPESLAPAATPLNSLDLVCRLTLGLIV